MEFGWRDVAVENTSVVGSYDERTIVFDLVRLPEGDVVMWTFIHERRGLRDLDSRVSCWVDDAFSQDLTVSLKGRQQSKCQSQIIHRVIQ
jgi:hypothetical protein